MVLQSINGLSVESLQCTLFCLYPAHSPFSLTTRVNVKSHCNCVYACVHCRIWRHGTCSSSGTPCLTGTRPGGPPRWSLLLRRASWCCWMESTVLTWGPWRFCPGKPLVNSLHKWRLAFSLYISAENVCDPHTGCCMTGSWLCMMALGCWGGTATRIWKRSSSWLTVNCRTGAARNPSSFTRLAPFIVTLRLLHNHSSVIRNT